MPSKKHFSILIISIFILGEISITGCSSNDCPLIGRPSARFDFFNSLTGSLFQFNDTLTVYSLGTDSILINKDTKINYFTLPLNYTSNETTFILNYKQLNDSTPTILRDTLLIYHTNIEHFVSLDCGIKMFYHLDSIRYTTHVMDSIIMQNPEIDDHEKGNFKIYFTPTAAGL